MKAIIVYFLCGVAFVLSQTPSQINCNVNFDEKKVIVLTNMVESCTLSVKDQVQKEIGASIQYLAMGAHFLKDSVNRPGFAKMFMHSASEEREHAMKLISYLLMRGELTKDISSLIDWNVMSPGTTTWENGLEALKGALALEKNVTQSIRDVIKKCEGDEKFNDYHLVDYLTGEFLDEQYKGERELAGRISTLSKMIKQQGSLADFLYDKELLE